MVRGVLGLQGVGHGGTLDPLATGLLAVLVGETTRATERLHTAPKVYDALVRFGSETATDDREGEPTRSAAAPTEAGRIEEGLPRGGVAGATLRLAQRDEELDPPGVVG